MTQVQFKRRLNTFTALIDGHADCNVNGSDPVCAACSILANTLANHLDDLRKAGYVHKLWVTMHEGYVTIKTKADPHAFEIVREAFAFTEKGFEILAEAHPGHVLVIPRLGEK